MSMDKISELCQCAALLALVANDLLLQSRMRRLEKKLQDQRVDIMAKRIRQALEPQFRTYKEYKEAHDGTDAE